MIPEVLLEEITTLQEGGYQIQHEVAGNRVYILFKDYPLPSGVYNQLTTSVLVHTTLNYPRVGFDMFWTDSTLKLTNGQPLKAGEHFEVHLNKNMRRFSIHPYQNMWNPNEHSLSSFLCHVEQRLKSGV